MKERPKRLEEVPRGRREVQGAESEEDFPPGGEPEVEGPGDGGGSAGVNTVEKALLELTKIAGRLKRTSSKHCCWKRRKLWWWKEECGSASCTDQMLEGESQVHLRSDRVEPPSRLSVQTCATGRASVSGNNCSWMVSCEEQGSKLPQPCSMGVASSWSVGLPNSREERRSPCEVRTTGWGCRSSQHRSRKLVDFECFPTGAASSISNVCNPRQPEHPRVPAYSALRSPVGGPVPQSPQGSRCLCGDKEEAGSKSNTTRVERVPDGGDPPNPKRKAKAKSKGGKGVSAEADE